MPVFIGRDVATKKECQVELDLSTSITVAKKMICDKLGLESKDHYLEYDKELLIYEDTLEDLELAGDLNPVLCVTKKPERTLSVPMNAFTMLGFPNFFNSRPEDSSGDEEAPREYHYAKSNSMFENDGSLSDPRKFMIANNSALVFRIQMASNHDYHSKDNDKMAGYLTSAMQKIVDDLSYEELERLATECLEINQRRMENYRDAYYNSFEQKPKET